MCKTLNVALRWYNKDHDNASDSFIAFRDFPRKKILFSVSNIFFGIFCTLIHGKRTGQFYSVQPSKNERTRFTYIPGYIFKITCCRRGGDLRLGRCNAGGINYSYFDVFFFFVNINFVPNFRLVYLCDFLRTRGMATKCIGRWWIICIRNTSNNIRKIKIYVSSIKPFDSCF